MIAYIETSAFLKLLISEIESAPLRARFRALRSGGDHVVSCRLLVTESHRAAHRISVLDHGSGHQGAGPGRTRRRRCRGVYGRGDAARGQPAFLGRSPRRCGAQRRFGCGACLQHPGPRGGVGRRPPGGDAALNGLAVVPAHRAGRVTTRTAGTADASRSMSRGSAVTTMPPP